MAVWTVQRAGNSSDASGTGPWRGGSNPASGTPGNGDSVIISNADLTVDVDTIYGASAGNYAAGTVEAAIRRTGSGTVNVAPGKRLTVRGDIIDSAGGVYVGYLLQLQAGSILEFDSSTSTPVSTAYKFSVDNSLRPSSSVLVRGAAGNPAIIRSVTDAGDTYGHGYFSYSGFTACIGMDIEHAEWYDIGDAGRLAVESYMYAHSGYSPVVWRWQDVKLVRCGGIANAPAIEPEGFTFSMLRVSCDDGRSAYDFQLASTNPLVSGTRYIGYCSFPKAYGQLDTPTTQLKDFTVEKCYFGRVPIWSNGAANGNFQIAVLQDVLVESSEADTGNQFEVPCAVVNRTYVVRNHDIDNPRFHRMPVNIDVTLDGFVSEHTGMLRDGVAATDAFGDDPIGPVSNPSGVRNYVIKHGLTLPNATRTKFSNITIFSTGGAGNNQRWDYQFNTVFGGTLVLGDQGTSAIPNVMQKFKNNLLYNPPAASVAMVDYPGSTSAGLVTTDPIPPAEADYNLFSGYATTKPAASQFVNQGKGYAAKWTNTPGTPGGPGMHDLPMATNPQFVDAGRSIVKFATDYLGVTGPAWQDAAAYAVGDYVTRAVPGWFDGSIITYRCIAAHTSSATTAPGNYAPGQWRTYWEFASFYLIRKNVTDATVRVTDPSLGLTNATYLEACYAWVRAGFRPQNPLLKNAASEGSDIGAMSVLDAGSTGSSLFLFNEFYE